MTKLHRILATQILSALLASAGRITAQAPATPAVPKDLQLTATSYIQYPSLNAVPALQLSMGPFGTSMWDIIAKEASNPKWNCNAPGFYKAVVVDKKLNVQRTLNIAAVRLIGTDPSTHLPYTHCEPGLPGIVDLVLGSKVGTGDLIQVFVYDENKQPLITSDGKLSIPATVANAFASITATPQAAPGESLNNGAARTVGQINIAFSDLNLARKSPVNVYVKSSDLLSTDGKDSKSAVSVTAGIQRGLLPRWYSPIHLDQTLQGNQTAKNLSTVTSLGLASDPYWLQTASLLNNHFIRAPLPPEPSIANLYTHRFEQLVTKKTPLLATDDYSLNPAFSWSNISFPFTCKLLFWEMTPAKTTTTPTSSAQTPICLGTELNLGLWYLPLDHSAHGSQQLEGYGDISILVPLSDFNVAARQLTFATKTDPTKFQIRIKYADAVNPANSYARTRQWTFGIEALK